MAAPVPTYGFYADVHRGKLGADAFADALPEAAARVTAQALIDDLPAAALRRQLRPPLRRPHTEAKGQAIPYAQQFHALTPLSDGPITAAFKLVHHCGTSRPHCQE